jgi:hypothetical protein
LKKKSSKKLIVLALVNDYAPKGDEENQSSCDVFNSWKEVPMDYPE